jgi:outer membrane protein assembly factor BamB
LNARRLTRAIWTVAILTVLLGTGCASASRSDTTSAAAPSGDWARFNYDAQRSGVGPRDTGITAGNVGRLQTRVLRLDGVADSSPIELHAVSVNGRTRDVAIVTTTSGHTIAFDPGTGARLWEFRGGGSTITTASPIADPGRRYVYATSPDGRIHKLLISSGREIRSGKWPVRATFDPGREKLAGALNISGRYVVAVTGGYFGDAPSYQGHVLTIDRGSGHIAHVWNSLCSNRHYLINPPRSCPASDSAIWARSGAVVEPGSRRLLVATGNGPFNGSTDWGDSVLELTPNASRLLHNWTPTDQAQLEANDTDVGSTAPALLPAYHGYRLAVQGGKDSQLHLLNLNRLNGTRGGAGGRLGGELQNIGAPGGAEVLTAPAVWTRGGRTLVFVGTGSGTAAYVLTGGRRPRLRSVWQNGSGGTSPVVAGGLLYVYDPGGSLKIYAPGSGRLLRSLDAASGHWSSPIAVGGRVLLPTGGSTSDDASSSQLFIYHLPGR